jgi:L,D-transpeptidase catalytic domain
VHAVVKDMSFSVTWRRRFVGVIALVSLVAVLLSPLATINVNAQDSGSSKQEPVSANALTPWSPPQTVYIPETGHSIDGVFLDFWRANGGYWSYGNPVSTEFTEDGHVVQYFEYARFEYWPDDPDGNVVHLGKLGEALRPYVVPRTPMFASSGDTAVKQAAQFIHAWLPVDAETAAQTITDAWTYLPETGHTVANGFKSFWERSGGVTFLGYPLTEEYEMGGKIYQVFERGQLAWEDGGDPWMVKLGLVLAKRYHVNTDPIDQGNLPVYSEELFIPPPTPPKRIEVNLTTQYLIAWEDDVAVNATYVSTGREGFETPEGTFHVLVKKEIEDMEGVIGGEYYNVPQVPWVMYFTNGGHALHGTYWHSNFGYPMSHGCVNLPMDFAEWLYGWAEIGTPVEIHF